MIESVRRWTVPVLAAVAVLAVIAVGVGVWQATSSNGEVGPADGAVGGGAGGGVPPDSGAEPPGSPVVVPGDPGADDPDARREPLPPDPEPGDGGREPGPDVIPIDSFYRYDARHLAINYYNGVPECYGKAGTPVVEERERRVLVTVPRTPPTAEPGTVCIEIALAGSVEIELQRPLGDRVVVDAATGRVLEEAASPYDDQQAQ